MCASTHVGSVDIYPKRRLAVRIKKFQKENVRFARQIISACMTITSGDVENAEMQQSSNTIANTIAQLAAAKNAEEMRPKSISFPDATTTQGNTNARFAAPSCSAVTTCSDSVVLRAKEVGSVFTIWSNTNVKSALAVVKHSRNSMLVDKHKKSKQGFKTRVFTV